MIANLRSMSLPASLRGYVCTDSRGLPRYWSTVWDTLHGADVAPSTSAGKLAAIDRFYRHVEEATGKDCLDAMLAEGDFDRIEAMLESFFIALRNVATLERTDSSKHWTSVFAFVQDILDRQGRVQNMDALALIQARLNRLDRLYGTLLPMRKPKRKVIRALPSSVVEDLYEVFSPDSQRNPYRTDVERWRNFCLFLLYLHQGLRRGEALILPVNAIREGVDPETGEIVQWINVVETKDDDLDPRIDRPQIKTAQSRRQIPIAADLAAAVEHYAMNFRGKMNHPFMFPSNRGMPLSKRAVNLVFEAASRRLSSTARKDLLERTGTETISPHPLRHTCAVYRLSEFINDGMEMPLALQLLRSFFGWSRTSAMPQHYAGAYFENRLLTVWRHRFDGRVSMLRALDALDRNYPMVGARI